MSRHFSLIHGVLCYTKHITTYLWAAGPDSYGSLTTIKRMEAIHSKETSAYIQAALRYIPEDGNTQHTILPQYTCTFMLKPKLEFTIQWQPREWPSQYISVFYSGFAIGYGEQEMAGS